MKCLLTKLSPVFIGILFITFNDPVLFLDPIHQMILLLCEACILKHSPPSHGVQQDKSQVLPDLTDEHSAVETGKTNPGLSRIPVHIGHIFGSQIYMYIAYALKSF